MLREKAIEIMKEYYNGDDNQINHSLKVLETAEEIAHLESLKDSFTFNVIILSSVFHDIGIPEARKKYNSSAPKYQELEGPEVARELMSKIDVRQDILERVCYIVGHHHTYESVDGIDFQVLYEADMVVNLQSGWSGVNREILSSDLESGSYTASGKKMILSHLS